MIGRILLALTLLVSAVSFADYSRKYEIKGRVGPFHVQPGYDVGVKIEGEAESALIRLCQPTQPGMDVNYYLYHRLNKAQSEGAEVLVIYNERTGKDPVTGRNKLCLIELVY
ncbi:MAG TPA: hypothetical protein VFV50_14120 [Bdellovibrionales bacterium]|nr:hypothetical protein [Bdellovibrionales bacterium]